MRVESIIPALFDEDGSMQLGDADWAAAVEDALGEDERGAIMGGTASRFFGLD